MQNNLHWLLLIA